MKGFMHAVRKEDLPLIGISLRQFPRLGLGVLHETHRDASVRGVTLLPGPAQGRSCVDPQRQGEMDRRPLEIDRLDERKKELPSMAGCEYVTERGKRRMYNSPIVHESTREI